MVSNDGCCHPEFEQRPVKVETIKIGLMRTMSYGDTEELVSDILYRPTVRSHCLQPAAAMRPGMQVGRAGCMCEARAGAG